MKANIALIGFMGAGKTIVGTALSKILDMDFIDLDEMIEKKAGMTINEIFEKYGEKRFRELETELAEDCKELDNSIISTGGGIVLNPLNVKHLKNASVVFLLWASAETTYERLKNKTNRPLLKVKDPKSEIKKLLDNRQELYEKSCDYKINTNTKSITEVAEEIKFHYLEER